MAGGTDQQASIVRTYSLAMFALAEAQGEIDVLYNELLELDRLIKTHPAFRAYLMSPRVDPESRRRAFERLFRGRCSDLFVDSLQVINRKGRLSLLPALIEAYRDQRDEALGRVQVEVQSAQALDDDVRDQVRDIARHCTGKEPELVEKVDATLLGGLVLRIGDQKLDASIATKLRRIANTLHERASREIHVGRLAFEGMTG